MGDDDGDPAGVRTLNPISACEPTFPRASLAAKPPIGRAKRDKNCEHGNDRNDDAELPFPLWLRNAVIRPLDRVDRLANRSEIGSVLRN
jgi:hypothetical protein